MVELSPEDHNNDHWEGNEDEGSRLTKRQDRAECVTGLHCLTLLGNRVDNPVKDLQIREHPIAIKKEKQGGVLEHTHRILRQHIVHCWRHLVSVG